MKKVLLAILTVFTLLTSTNTIFAEPEIQHYWAVDMDSISVDNVSNFIGEIRIMPEGDAYRLIVNGESLGTFANEGFFTYYASNVRPFNFIVDMNTKTVSVAYKINTEDPIDTVFRVHQSDLSYAVGNEDVKQYIDVSCANGQTITLSSDLSVIGTQKWFIFDDVSYVYKGKIINITDIKINVNENKLYYKYKCDEYSKSLSGNGVTTRELYVEIHVDAQELELKYLAGPLNARKTTFENAQSYNSQGKFYTDSEVEAGVKGHSIHLFSNINRTKYYSDETVTQYIYYWERTNPGSQIGDGIYNRAVEKKQIQVVCQWNESVCESVRSKYGVPARPFAVVKNTFDYVEAKKTESNYKGERLVYSHRTIAKDKTWDEIVDIKEHPEKYGLIINDDENKEIQYSSRSRNWQPWSEVNWTNSYFGYCTPENKCESKEGTGYRYRVKEWSDWSDWSASSYGCPSDYCKSKSRTGKNDECGTELKWYEFSDYGAASKTTYGEKGGCNSYYGASEVCGQYVKWYDFANYGGASASMYGETGGCNSYYGASSVCGYKTCENSACGYNTCEAQSCGYATCASASACGYETCRTSACGTESYVSSYTCANYNSKTCYKNCNAHSCNCRTVVDRQYSCNCSSYSCNCKTTSYSCNCRQVCNRYAGKSCVSYTQSCSTCKSTSCSTCQSCQTCSVTHQECSTCYDSCPYDCSYTTYDGACYGTRNKECANSACGAKTCTSATCGYNKCADSSCGAKTCTTSACGNKECTWYTCPSSKTPVYGNNECTWYTCPSSKTPVYGNKSCTSYSYSYSSWGDWSEWYDPSGWSSTIDNYLYSLPSSDVEKESRQLYKYRYKVWGDWSDYIKGNQTSPYGPFEDTEFRYKLDAIVGETNSVQGEFYDGSVSSNKFTNDERMTYSEINEFAEKLDIWKAMSDSSIQQAASKYYKQNNVNSLLYNELWNYAKYHKNSSIAGDTWKNRNIFLPYIFITDHIRANIKNFPVEGYDNQTFNAIRDTIKGEEGPYEIGPLPLEEKNEPVSRNTKVIYYDYRDPLANYHDDLPENWEGYQALLEEIKNSDMNNIQVSVTLSDQDIREMKTWLENGGYSTLGTCEMLREFSYIFGDMNEELAEWLNSGSSCKLKKYCENGACSLDED